MSKNVNNIGFIGAGKMASAILNGMLKSDFIKNTNVFIYDKNEEASNLAREKFGVNVASNYSDVLNNCKTIIMATKPFVVDEVLDGIKDYIDNHLIISILAGVSTSRIEGKLKNTRVVRVMPNTPALVGAGMSAVCKGAFADDSDSDFVLSIFSKLGEAIKIDEKYIDIITAISGSGPAYYYYLIDEMARAGEKLGLDYETCLKLSSQTALGSALMIQKSGIDVKTLIKNVTTPGGCTEVGNNVLLDSDVSEVMYKTIKDTMEKAKSLG